MAIRTLSVLLLDASGDAVASAPIAIDTVKPVPPYPRRADYTVDGVIAGAHRATTGTDGRVEISIYPTTDLLSQSWYTAAFDVGSGTRTVIFAMPDRDIDLGRAVTETAGFFSSEEAEIAALRVRVAALEASTTPPETVRKVNTALGGTDWQHAPGTVTGITLAQAIAAVQIDAMAAANGLELTRTPSQTEVVLGLRRIVSEGAFVGWSTTRSVDAAWFAAAGANFDAPNEGTVAHGVAIPDTGAGFVAGYVVFALPSSAGFPSHVITQGFRQPTAAFTEEGTVTHGGTNFTIGVSANPLAPAFAGRLMEWEF